MKILQICTKVPFPPKDGGSAAIFAISSSLAKLGNHVTIFAINPPKHLVDLSKYDVPENIRIESVEINTAPSLTGAILNLLFSGKAYHITRFNPYKVKKKLAELLRDQPYDIIQFEGIYTCGLLSVIKKYTNAKITLRAHNIEHILWDDIANSIHNLLKRIYLKIQVSRLKKSEIRLWKIVDAIIPISDIDSTVISKYSNRKTFTLPYYVELKPDEFKTPNYQKTDICYIGALDWIPNQEGILWFIQNICPTLNIHYPSLKLHIAGRNAPVGLIKEFRKYPNIIYHGEINDSGLFLNSYKALIVPLFTGGGMRVKIIDALTQGIPVLSSQKAIEGTKFINNKHLLVANTPEDFINQISKLIQDNNLSTQLLKEGYRYICNNYSNLQWDNKLVNFYEFI